MEQHDSHIEAWRHALNRAVDLEAAAWARFFNVVDAEAIEGRRAVMRANIAVGHVEPLKPFLGRRTAYSIHLSRNIAGFGKPRVPAVRAALVGHHRNGDIVRPDVDAVRSCLPYRYRKAFDRAHATFWFSSDDNTAAYCTLRDRRGLYLNTVYAIPCDAET